MGVTRFRAFALALGLAGIVGLLVALPALAAGTTVTVTPSNMQGWFFLTENPVDGIGTGTLVAGPATPPLGAGSARLPAPATTDGQALVSSAYQGTKLADISQLQYSTYVTSASGPQAIALQFTVDRDVTDVTDVFNGRLVFEPYQGAPAGTVQQGTWQTWSPLQGLWWGTGSDPSSRPFGAACPQSNPCTWEKILTLFPDAGILEGDPNGIVFKAGSGWSNFSGNIDKFVIGINGTDTTYDFEAVSLPTYTTSFLSPFDSSSGQAVIKNLTKAGRVIPVKIRILENGVAYDGSKPAPTIRVSQPFACDGSAPSDALPDVTAAGQANTGTSFRWSADAPGFWIYNLDTKSLNLQVDKCYRIDVLVGTTVVTTQTYGILQITK